MSERSTIHRQLTPDLVQPDQRPNSRKSMSTSPILGERNARSIPPPPPPIIGSNSGSGSLSIPIPRARSTRRGKLPGHNEESRLSALFVLPEGDALFPTIPDDPNDYLDSLPASPNDSPLPSPTLEAPKQWWDAIPPPIKSTPANDAHSNVKVPAPTPPSPLFIEDDFDTAMDDVFSDKLQQSPVEVHQNFLRSLPSDLNVYEIISYLHYSHILMINQFPL